MQQLKNNAPRGVPIKNVVSTIITPPPLKWLVQPNKANIAPLRLRPFFRRLACTLIRVNRRVTYVI